MTIRKGAEWGEQVARPADLLVAASDAELGHLVGAGAGHPLGLAGGDLLRTLGGGGAGPDVRRLPLDALRVDADGTELCAVAHVVARRSWWRGPLIGVFNAEYLGRWDVAPRGHPNDGRAEVVEVDAAMPVRTRVQAWRRLPAGIHVPHPAIRATQRASVEWDLAAPLVLYVDGRRHGPVRHLAVRVEADAYVLHV